MSLSTDSPMMTMPVQPANTCSNGGFGWGDGGLLWIIILFLFAFCGGVGRQLGAAIETVLALPAAVPLMVTS